MINFQLSTEQLQKASGCSKELAELYLPSIFGTCKRFNINTEKRIAMFLAQIGHESSGLSRIIENLNYSKEGLLRVFPKYFPTNEMAVGYARMPERIANRVYANRMGNGSESSGDGWKFRGRGFIQLTGKDNYSVLSAYFKEDFVGNPDLVLEPVWAAASAGWFWTSRNLNSFADKEDIVGCTKKVNGGVNGLEDRKQRYITALEALRGLDAMSVSTGN